MICPLLRASELSLYGRSHVEPWVREVTMLYAAVEWAMKIQQVIVRAC